MTLILGRQDVESLLTMDLTMDAVEEAFAEYGSGRTQIPERQAIALKKYNGVIGVMPGYLERLEAAGLKLIFHHEETPKTMAYRPVGAWSSIAIPLRGYRWPSWIAPT